MATLKQLIDERVLILDGAMGTMIQRYNLSEQDFRIFSAVSRKMRKIDRFGVAVVINDNDLNFIPSGN